MSNQHFVNSAHFVCLQRSELITKCSGLVWPAKASVYSNVQSLLSAPVSVIDRRTNQFSTLSIRIKTNIALLNINYKKSHKGFRDGKTSAESTGKLQSPLWIMRLMEEMLSSVYVRDALLWLLLTFKKKMVLLAMFKPF